MNKEKLINWIESLEDEANKSNKYFIERNDLFIKNQELQQENKQLQDNWNKLKKHIQGCLDEALENDVYDRTSYEQGVIACLESSLFELEELEKGDINE